MGLIKYFRSINKITEEGNITPQQPIIREKTCPTCGKVLKEQYVFCPQCGQNVNETPEKPETKMKDFYFDSKCTNSENIAVVNQWLLSHKILIQDIKMQTYMNTYRWWTVETTFNEMKITYTSSEKGKYCQMACFCLLAYTVQNNQRMIERLHEWQAQHPDCHIVKAIIHGHQITSGATKTLYFWYYTE